MLSTCKTFALHRFLTYCSLVLFLFLHDFCKTLEWHHLFQQQHKITSTDRRGKAKQSQKNLRVPLPHRITTTMMPSEASIHTDTSNTPGAANKTYATAPNGAGSSSRLFPSSFSSTTAVPASSTMMAIGGIGGGGLHGTRSPITTKSTDILLPYAVPSSTQNGQTYMYMHQGLPVVVIDPFRRDIGFPRSDFHCPHSPPAGLYPAAASTIALTTCTAASAGNHIPIVSPVDGADTCAVVGVCSDDNYNKVDNKKRSAPSLPSLALSSSGGAMRCKSTTTKTITSITSKTNKSSLKKTTRDASSALPKSKKAKRSKRWTWKKPKGKPKRPLSAYNL